MGPTPTCLSLGTSYTEQDLGSPPSCAIPQPSPHGSERGVEVFLNLILPAEGPVQLVVLVSPEVNCQVLAAPETSLGVGRRQASIAMTQ